MARFLKIDFPVHAAEGDQKNRLYQLAQRNSTNHPIISAFQAAELIGLTTFRRPAEGMTSCFNN
jgi:hypothetical protein